MGDWLSGRAPRSHRGGHWFESSIAHHEQRIDPFGFAEGVLLIWDSQTGRLITTIGSVMTSQEIIAELTQSNGVFPLQAVREAISQREAIAPELLHILEYAVANIAEVARQEDYVAHLCALYLLAQFREERAYQPMVNLACGDWTHVDMTLGDIITEDLGRMLASVCNGDTSLICAMIENESLNEYVRGAAMDSLVVLVARGVKSRDEVMAYFQSLFQGKLVRQPGLVWGSLVAHCCDIYPLEVAEDIQQAFADDLVDTTYIGESCVQRDMKAGKERTLERLTKKMHYTFVDDTVREMSRWPCFQKQEPAPKASMPQQYWTPAPIRTEPKVGRNEPCPCGSGKKYKKCCGA
jgi:uncharacterized protein YchJ